MYYKLLALDIDGTLLNSEKKITPRVRTAIRAAVEKGCHVLLATGRMYRAMERINRSLGLSMPCMVCGGAQIVKDGKILYSRPVQPELAHEVLCWAHDNGIYAQAYMGDDFVYEKETEFTKIYSDYVGFTGKEVPDLRQRMDLQTPKILLISDLENTLLCERMANERFGKRLHISRSGPVYLELNDPNASKGNALDFMVRQLGITSANCIAMGDATVDLPMIEYAGLGVAMANADELTKSHADLVCPGNDEDGVAVIVEEYILGSRR